MPFLQILDGFSNREQVFNKDSLSLNLENRVLKSFIKSLFTHHNAIKLISLEDPPSDISHRHFFKRKFTFPSIKSTQDTLDGRLKF